MTSSYVGRQNSWAPIEKCETEISVKKVSALPTIKRTQFPLTLAWASTVHKVQGLSLNKVLLILVSISKSHLGLGKYILRSAE